MILARVAIAACVYLVLASCASAENDDLAAVAENPSTTAVEVESVDATETTDSATELDADEPDPAAATTTTAPPATEAPTTTAAAEPAPNPDSPLNGTFATVGGQSIDLATLQG